MIIRFKKETFLSTVTPLLYTVSGKNTIPSIEGIHIKCTDATACKVETTDLEKGIRTFLDCEILEEGECVINAQKLLQIVKAMPDGDINLTVDEKFKTTVENGLSRFTINALPGNDFPSMPDIEGERGFLIPQYMFRKFVNRIYFAIGQNDSRPVFNGAYFQISGKSMTIVSCDGNRLAHCEKEVELVNRNKDGSALNLKFIVPGKTLSELLKMVKDTEDDMEIRLSRRWVIFTVGTFTFFSKTIDAEYFDYNRILPKEKSIVTYVKAEELRSALERSSLIVEDRLAGSIRSYVKFTVTDKLLISTESNNGNVFDELNIRKECGNEIVIGFNCKFMLDTLRVCDDGEMRVSFNNPLMGVLIEPLDESDGRFKYFVMPIRMNN